jgi:hypothetical protein
MALTTAKVRRILQPGLNSLFGTTSPFYPDPIRVAIGHVEGHGLPLEDNSRAWRMLRELYDCDVKIGSFDSLSRIDLAPDAIIYYVTCPLGEWMTQRIMNRKLSHHGRQFINIKQILGDD